MQLIERNDPTPLWARSAKFHSQSALLSKLPPEIRLLVWKQCLGGMRFHLIFNSTTRSKITCRNTDIADKCCRASWSHQDKVNQSVLLTCRQVCSEAIELLYSANISHFHTEYALKSLSQSVLPQHFHAIRSLRFAWFLAGVPATDIKTETDKYWALHSEREWRTAWQCVASRQELKFLHVELHIRRRMTD